ncbi:manganese efflux pump MntP family protein [Halothermothrix orenii]|uniref:Predicted membrane protein n=1 Tax=Halothermothrix orenii (strain H 168 / OCM 544 / DSM 9562) TaxID=373903 RepID=B8CZ24_HALOH|nr:manganese efflux pump MntP family protein [Halothermothrix orenii]ACL70543.1 predicted membrane protein [Halothermothrix orenii H 168]
MGFIEVAALAVALGTDAFSVAVVVGVQQFKPSKIVEISAIIGLFHIIMPLTGYYGGHAIEELVTRYFWSYGQVDKFFKIIGAGLLLLIGFYMIVEKWLGREQELKNFDLTGWGIIALAISVSMDALSVGISLGMLDVGIFAVVLFGGVATVMMASGLSLGSKVGSWIGDDTQVIGGLALIYLGLHFMGLV